MVPVRSIDETFAPTYGRSGHLAGWGLLAVLAGAAIVGLMHVVGPSARVSLVRRTISEYALLDNGWVFNLAVLLLAIGSLAVLGAVVRSGLLRPVSIGSMALLLWSLGLAGVVLFPKHNWAVGPSTTGDLHRVASLVAFLSLPVAALAAGLVGRRDPRWRAYAHASLGLGMLCLLCFSPIAFAFALEPVTGVRWWRAIPLGAVERALAFTEVTTVLALGWWAARASPPAATPAATRAAILDDLGGQGDLDHPRSTSQETVVE